MWHLLHTHKHIYKLYLTIAELIKIKVYKIALQLVLYYRRTSLIPLLQNWRIIGWLKRRRIIERIQIIFFNELKVVFEQQSKLTNNTSNSRLSACLQISMKEYDSIFFCKINKCLTATPLDCAVRADNG